MADPLSRKTSRAYVGAVSLAREGENSKIRNLSDLLPDRILLSPLDYAGEYEALEADPNTEGLHFKP